MEGSSPRELHKDNAAPPLEAGSAASTTVPDLQMEGKLGPLPTSQIVHFRCHAPGARSVSLTGTFNGWDPQATPMAKNRNGVWSVAVALEPGRYRYEYVLDESLGPASETNGEDWPIPDCVSKGKSALNRMIEVA